MKEVIQRAGKPTPAFFRQIQRIGIFLAGISAAILASPVTLPAIVITIAGYAALGGSVAAAVSQLAVDKTVEPDPEGYGEMPDYLPPYLKRDYVGYNLLSE